MDNNSTVVFDINYIVLIKMPVIPKYLTDNLTIFHDRHDETTIFEDKTLKVNVCPIDEMVVSRADETHKEHRAVIKKKMIKDNLTLIEVNGIIYFTNKQGVDMTLFNQSSNCTSFLFRTALCINVDGQKYLVTSPSLVTIEPESHGDKEFKDAVELFMDLANRFFLNKAGVLEFR